MWAEIGTAEIGSPVALEEFLGNPSWWNGKYERIRININELRGNVNGAKLECLFKIDGAYQQAPGDYVWGVRQLFPNGGGTFGNPVANAMLMTFMGSSDLAENAISGVLEITDPGSTTVRKRICSSLQMGDSSGNFAVESQASGAYIGDDPDDITQPLEGVGLQMTNGSIVAGRFIIEGLSEAE